MLVAHALPVVAGVEDGLLALLRRLLRLQHARVLLAEPCLPALRHHLVQHRFVRELVQQRRQRIDRPVHHQQHAARARTPRALAQRVRHPAHQLPRHQLRRVRRRGVAHRRPVAQAPQRAHHAGRRPPRPDRDVHRPGPGPEEACQPEGLRGARRLLLARGAWRRLQDVGLLRDAGELEADTLHAAQATRKGGGGAQGLQEGGCLLVGEEDAGIAVVVGVEGPVVRDEHGVVGAGVDEVHAGHLRQRLAPHAEALDERDAGARQVADLHRRLDEPEAAVVQHHHRPVVPAVRRKQLAQNRLLEGPVQAGACRLVRHIDRRDCVRGVVRCCVAWV